MKNYIYFSIIVSLAFFYNCSNKQTKTDHTFNHSTYDSLYYDLENIKDGTSLVKDYSIRILGYHNQEESFSGKSCVEINATSPYGLHFTDKVHKGEYFTVSVYRKGNKKAGLVMSCDNREDFYLTEERSIKKIGEWELLKVSFEIPESLHQKEIKIYVFNGSNESTFFDDLTILRYNKKPAVDYLIEPLNIEFPDSSLNKLKAKRNAAIKKGILITEKNDYVPANLIYESDTTHVLMRLKGDWLDHIKGNKWSYRIKSEKSFTFWKGLKKFSLQAPETRGNIKEWVYHQMLIDEDLLATEYGFIPVSINKRMVGVYAYEEHFHKRLLESKNRREGPILKFSEDDMFYKLKNNMDRKENTNIPIIESSTINTFGSKTLKKKNLRNQFLLAQDLLYSYKTESIEVKKVFDLDKTAKYYAITDLTRSYHSLAWHNQRFYFNPMNSKFEIIAFDGNTPDASIHNWVDTDFFGLMSENETNVNIYNYNLNLFKNSEFVSKYIYYLKKYSNPVFIDDFFKKHMDEILEFETLIKIEKENYKYNSNFIKTNAERIRRSLPKYINDFNNKTATVSSNPLNKTIYDTTFNLLYAKVLVKAQVNKTKDGIGICSFYPKDLQLIGTSNVADSINYYYNNKIIIPKYKNKLKTISRIKIPKTSKDKHLFFKDLETLEVFSIKLIDIPYPSKISIPNHSPEIPFYSVVNKKLIFKKGYHTIRQNIITPKGYTVYIPAGTTLDFINSSSLICQSNIEMIGRKHSKIMICSSDQTSRGFAVIKAEKKSILRYVSFDQLNTLENDNYSLTGAITFFESDVEFSNCIFKNNYSEDALNTFRSNFSMDSCSFLNIYADAFDSDFCTGKITNSTFINIGNDAIDFSGSKCTIDFCNLENINDKAFSAGENSQLLLTNNTVLNSNIGVSAKDKSFVKIENMSLDKCNYGVTSFRKKSEFGPASIEANNLIIRNSKTKYLIELKSILTIDSKEIQGDQENISALFY